MDAFYLNFVMARGMAAGTYFCVDQSWSLGGDSLLKWSFGVPSVWSKDQLSSDVNRTKTLYWIALHSVLLKDGDERQIDLNHEGSSKFELRVSGGSNKLD